MSETVKYKGKLKPVLLADGQSVEDKIREMFRQSKYWNDTYERYPKEYIEDIYYNANGYVIINENLYLSKVVSLDVESSYCNIKLNGDVYEYEAQFYNGGTCLSEMLEQHMEDKINEN